MKTHQIPGGYLVPDDTHIGKWQKECGRLDHDAFTVSAIAPWIARDAVIYDVGAFDGDHTIEYSQLAPGGRIEAYEPNQLAFECLRHNVKLFPNENVYATNTALGAENGGMGMKLNENLGASCMTNSDECWVPVFTIDHFQREKLDFIKLDCEGFEPNVIRGGIETIERCKPAMLIEINHGALSVQGFTAEDIYDPLTEIGYEFQIIQPDLNPESPMFDVLAIPRL